MNNFLNAKELKEQGSIVDLLTRLGFQPVKKTAKEHVYRSMLRDSDTKPSFSVNDELGVWYDHGTGKGGNIIDFGLAYWKQLSFHEVIEKIQEVCTISAGIEKRVRTRKPVKIPHYVIEDIKDIGTHPAITNYLKNRGVFAVAGSGLYEVYYYVKDLEGRQKCFFAAGWENESGGWEVRNKYFKGCLGTKAISFVPGHEKQLCVFEGYINYLSWKCENPEAGQSILVLNSLALLKAGIAKAKEFSSIDVYFDRDAPGHTATKEFIKSLPYATDRSESYLSYNDYNDKLRAELQGKSVNDIVETKQKTALRI